jgi:hypothetical protein
MSFLRNCLSGSQAWNTKKSQSSKACFTAKSDGFRTILLVLLGAALTTFDKQPTSVGNGSMVAFLAATPAAVDTAYAAGSSAGGADTGSPGPRTHYGDGYYGAYLRDPDHNKVHLACRGDISPTMLCWLYPSVGFPSWLAHGMNAPSPGLLPITPILCVLLDVVARGANT